MNGTVFFLWMEAYLVDTILKQDLGDVGNKLLPLFDRWKENLAESESKKPSLNFSPMLKNLEQSIANALARRLTDLGVAPDPDKIKLFESYAGQKMVFNNENDWVIVKGVDGEIIGRFPKKSAPLEK